MQAIITWGDGECSTTCTAKLALPAPKRGGTDFKLQFERKWWRVCKDKDGMFVKIGGACGPQSRVEIVP